MSKYNGWASYENWNVMLWLNGTENLYFGMMQVIEDYEEIPSYIKLILCLGLENENTGDGTPFLNSNLDYVELDKHIKDMKLDLSSETTTP